MDRGLSYIKGKNILPLDYSSIGKALETSARENKNKLFVVAREEQRNVTFGEMLVEADKLAAGLLEIGLQSGDKIGIIINNCVEALIINFACIRGGFISVNLNPALQHREVEYCVKLVELNCVICLDIYKTFNILDILKNIVPEIDDPSKDVLFSKNVPSLKHVIVVSDIKYRGTSSFDSIKHLGKSAPENKIHNLQDNIKHEDLFTIIFTSGTTGNPKAVGLNHFQMTNTIRIIGRRLGLHENTTKLCFVLPIFHVFGLGFSLIFACHDTTLVLPSYYYDPEKNLEAISNEKCTDMLGTPTMFGDLIAVQKTMNLELALEQAHCAGAASSERLCRDIVDILKVKHLRLGYGTTETLALSWPLLTDDIDFTSKSIGYLIDHVEGKIVDSSGRTVPIGTVGELYVRGFSVIKRYYAGSSDAFDEDGWFKTGDAIYFDNQQQLHLVGRLKEIINRGGEKISPMEVEEILESHVDIVEAHVVGAPHKRLGEVVCACLKLKPDSTITLEEVQRFCKGKLSYYKIPARIEIMETFPKTVLGKIQKTRLLHIIKLLTKKTFSSLY